MQLAVRRLACLYFVYKSLVHSAQAGAGAERGCCLSVYGICGARRGAPERVPGCPQCSQQRAAPAAADRWKGRTAARRWPAANRAKLRQYRRAGQADGWGRQPGGAGLETGGGATPGGLETGSRDDPGGGGTTPGRCRQNERQSTREARPEQRSVWEDWALAFGGIVLSIEKIVLDEE